MERMDIWTILEIVYQMMFFLAGTLVNSRAFYRIVRFLRRLKRNKKRSNVVQTGRLPRLSLHLIIANLLVLWIHCLSKTIWLVTYYWYGGDALCRIIIFLSTFAFHLWSNMVAVIAIDMYFCIANPIKSRLRATAMIKKLIAAAYGFAGILSFPQLIVRGTVSVPETQYLQCYFLFFYSKSAIIAYGVYHAVTVFYFPLALMLISYIGVACNMNGSFRKESAVGKKFSLGQRESKEGKRRRSSVASSKRQLLKTSFQIVGTYILTWLPYQILVCCQLACNPDDKCADVLKKFDWLVVVLLASTCINPFLYKFQKAKVESSIERAALLHRNLSLEKAAEPEGEKQLKVEINNPADSSSKVLTVTTVTL